MYDDLLHSLKSDLSAASNLEAVSALWQQYLGKEGKIKKLLKDLGAMTIEEKRERGPLIQDLSKKAQAMFDERQAALSNATLSERLRQQAEALSFVKPKIGHLHPLSETIRELNSFFEGLGYSVYEEREIENDEFCFQRLNVPADHPARDMQDTIYIAEPHTLLRTQTS